VIASIYAISDTACACYSEWSSNPLLIGFAEKGRASLRFIDGELSFTTTSSWRPKLRNIDGIGKVSPFIRSCNYS
jgi:hypothetical protein